MSHIHILVTTKFGLHFSIHILKYIILDNVLYEINTPILNEETEIQLLIIHNGTDMLF